MDPEQTLPATDVDPAHAGAVGEPAGVPRTLGRYTVLERLGSGAMGIVFAAYDPQLDRRVAVKLLKWQGDQSGQQRLLEEARALAQLSHPNVVAVHDVGEFDTQAFIAMAFVDGPTLRTWATEPQRSWRETLDVLVAAGRGLAAAHDAGFIHRDFKPDNVIVDRNDGQPRVVDFGLAMQQEGAVESSGEHDLDERSHDDSRVAGTPAYMAPEVFEGRPADVLTDQFSFCASAYEILYGQRPFGQTLGEIIERLDEGRVAEPPDGAVVPAWVRRAIVRGLRREPSERWPSMHALLTALEDDPQRRRRFALGVGVAGLGIAAGSAALALSIGSEPQPCQDAVERLAPAWSPERREQVREAILATGVGYAASASERVIERLDAYAEAWRAGYVDACGAHARGEQSGDLLDLRMACLARHRDELSALAGALGEVDRARLAKADQVIEQLHPLDRCADSQALRERTPLPRDPAQREEIERISTALSELRVLDQISDDPHRREEIERLVESARQIGYTPLLAHARFVEGRILRRAAPDTAVAALDEVLYLTIEGNDPFLAAEATTLSVELLGFAMLHPHAADRRAADAAWFIERVARTDSESARRLEVALLVARAKVGLRREDWRGVDALTRAALERLEAIGGEQLDMAAVHGIRGWAAQAEDNFGDALARYEDAVAQLVDAVGPDHPSVGLQHNNIGLMLKNLGKTPQAIESFERALAIVEPALGAGDSRTTMVLRNLGNAYISLPDYPRAVEALDRVWAFERERRESIDGAEISMVHYSWALEDLGRHEDAAERYEESLRRAERAKNPRKQATFFKVVCDGHVRRGELDRAVEAGERGLRALQADDEPDPVAQAIVALALARVLDERDRPEDREYALRLAGQAHGRFDAAGMTRQAEQVEALEQALRAERDGSVDATSAQPPRG